MYHEIKDSELRAQAIVLYFQFVLERDYPTLLQLAISTLAQAVGLLVLLYCFHTAGHN